ncbi:MAG: hypothetical protein JWR27_1459 [Aeromicrobium sp.]|jgi:uncharacterized membrane protein YjgN (DUF898 family)|nr:hypothetical protein [Aeromicrobium sp.]
MSQMPPPPPSSGAQPAYGPQKHPRATTALVLGILGVVACGVVAPFAWVIGGKAVREIDASPGTYGGRSEANAGKILGIVGSALLVLSVLALIALVIVAVATGDSSSDGSFDYSLAGLAGR